MLIGFTLILAQVAVQDFGATQEKAWRQFGAPRLQRGLPQTVPLHFYSRVVYDFGPKIKPEDDIVSTVAVTRGPRPWWTSDIGGHKVGGPAKQGNISIPEAARAAWGMMWWGTRLQQHDWKERAQELLNLTLAAPVVEGGFHADRFVHDPVTWGGASNLTTDAQTAYWYLRWLEKWPDSERKVDMLALVNATIVGCEAQQLEFDRMLASERRPGIRIGSGHMSDRRLDPFSSRLLCKVIQSKFVPLEWRGTSRNIITRARAGYFQNSTLSSLGGVVAISLEEERIGFVRAKDKLGVTEFLAQRVTLQDDAMTPIDDFGRMDNSAPDDSLALMRAGAALHRKDLFERGVAAMRASLNQLNEGTLVANGIKVPSGTPLGTMCPASYGKFSDFDIVTGFVTLEGQMLANFAEALDEFGGFYKDPTGWAVGIDGCRPGTSGEPVSTLSSNPFPYSGEHKVEIVSPGKPRRRVDVTVLPSICRLEVELTPNGMILLAIPGAMPHSGVRPKLSGTFKLDGRSWKGKATIGPRGFQCKWPKGVTKGKFSFTGKIGNSKVTFGPVQLPS